MIFLGLTAAVAHAQLHQAELNRNQKWLPFSSQTLGSLPDYQIKPANLALSKYGGWKERRVKGTGFFRVEKIQDRWWAIDPEGYLYVHLALNSVNLNYSKPDEIYAMMRKHGFNGFGCWTDESIVQKSTVKDQTPMAYCPKISFIANYRKKRVPRIEMPVFDDAFEVAANEMAKGFLPYVNDPHVFGYLSDNELDFNSDGLSAHLAINDPQDKNYTTAIQFLKLRGKDTIKPDDADHRAYMGLMGERYYSVVSAAIRKIDKNHMYLGSRCHSSEKGSKEFMMSAGKYVDVFSMNHYNRWSNRSLETRNMALWSGRPLMVTEFYTMTADAGLRTDIGAGWHGKDQKSRALFYQNFVSTMAESGHVVGFHWFKYDDGANNTGVINAKGELYSQLMQSMQQMNQQIYNYIEYADSRPAPVVVLSPVADAYFEGSRNRGTNPELKTKFSSSPSSKTFRQIYIRFDVAKVAHKIGLAKIVLHSMAAGSESGEFQAELIAEDNWDETKIHSGNAPAGAMVLHTWSDGGGDVTIDVTAAVASAIATDGKISIRIRSISDNGSMPEYGSREHPDPVARPKLIIY